MGGVDRELEVFDQGGQAAGGQMGEQQAGELDGAALGLWGADKGDRLSFQFCADEGVVEPNVVGGEYPLTEQGKVLGPNVGGGGCPLQHLGVDTGKVGDSRGDGDSRIDQVSLLVPNAAV